MPVELYMLRAAFEQMLTMACPIQLSRAQNGGGGQLWALESALLHRGYRWPLTFGVSCTALSSPVCATGNGSGCTILKADYLAKEAGILSHNDTPIGNHRCDDHEGVRLSNMVRWRASSSWPEGWFYFI